MASVNKVIVLGNLGADPEIRRFDNGGIVANLSIATTERWTDKATGQPREQTEWHRVVFSNRLAEIAEQYLKKGSSVYVEGSLRTRKWTDNQGQERYITEIRADNMQMLGRRSDGAGSYSNQGFANQNNQGQGFSPNLQYGSAPNQTAQPKNSGFDGNFGNNFNNNAPRQNQFGTPNNKTTTPNTAPNNIPQSTSVDDDDMPF